MLKALERAHARKLVVLNVTLRNIAYAKFVGDNLQISTRHLFLSQIVISALGQTAKEYSTFNTLRHSNRRHMLM